MLVCIVCKEDVGEKPVRGTCRRCYHREYNRAYFARPEVKAKALQRQATPKRKAYQSRKARKRQLGQYGLSLDDYAALAAKQGGKCAVCAAAFDATVMGKGCVDHCHATGRVRGLLCGGCNTSIGKLGDTAESLIRAAEYLVKFEESSRPTTST